MSESPSGFYPLNRSKFARRMIFSAAALFGCMWGFAYAPRQTSLTRITFGLGVVVASALFALRAVGWRNLSPGLAVNDEGLSCAGERPIPWAALKTMRAIEFGAGDSSVFYFELARETAARMPRSSLLWRRSARVMLNCANYQGSRNLVAEIERRWKAAHPT